MRAGRPWKATRDGASSSQRCRSTSPGKSSRSVSSIAAMSAGSPDSAAQRNGPMPLFCRGIGPFRWAALSGDPADIAAIDDTLRELFPGDVLLQRWLELAPSRVAFQGLPARICWLGYGDRAKAGVAINELVRSGKVKAPVVI